MFSSISLDQSYFGSGGNFSPAVQMFTRIENAFRLKPSGCVL
jgi:hypothetical protein